MRKFLITGMCIAGLVLFTVSQVEAYCPPCGHGKHHEVGKHHECECLNLRKQAKIKVTKIKNGATIKVTSNNKDIVKKIQEITRKLQENWETDKCIHKIVTEHAKKETVKVNDVVCGMKVDKAKALSSENKGSTYYFCSQQCKESFLKEPAKYIK